MLDQALADTRARTVTAVDASKSSVTDVYGVGPIGAAIILGHSGDIRRFPTAGTTPATTAPPRSKRRRAQGQASAQPRGDRQLNHAIHTAALTQIAHDHHGRAYYLRKQAEGKTKKEALRALKRRISDVVYRQLSPTPRLTHAPSSTCSASTRRHGGPGGQRGDDCRIQRDRPRTPRQPALRISHSRTRHDPRTPPARRARALFHAPETYRNPRP